MSKDPFTYHRNQSFMDRRSTWVNVDRFSHLRSRCALLEPWRLLMSDGCWLGVGCYSGYIVVI